MIAVQAHAQGAILPVRAKPGAKVNRPIDERDGALRVSVTAAPEAGKANEAIIKVLADMLNIRRSDVILLTGDTSRLKRFLIVGIGPEDLLIRIEGAIEPTVFEPDDPEV